MGLVSLSFSGYISGYIFTHIYYTCDLLIHKHTYTEINIIILNVDLNCKLYANKIVTFIFLYIGFYIRFHLRIKVLCLENLQTPELQHLQDSPQSKYVIWCCPFKLIPVLSVAAFSLNSMNSSLVLLVKHPQCPPVHPLHRFSFQTQAFHEISPCSAQ